MINNKVKEYLFGTETRKLYQYERELSRRMYLEAKVDDFSPPSRMEENLDIGLTKIIPRLFGLACIYEGIRSVDINWFYLAAISELISAISSFQNRTRQNKKVNSLEEAYVQVNSLTSR